ncbi:NADH kinase pos5 [Sporothrix eucalyptigena]|uniref:NADH kinase pos5 n=1 Tax=Sporothrix eucalyptigena TaxID=1812306 RepID=A0ABP0CK92_9PEZI
MASKPVSRALFGVFDRGTCRPRLFSTTPVRRELLDVAHLQDRIVPRYEETTASSLLSLQWPQPPRNVLIMPKLHAPHVTRSAIEFARHLSKNYPDLRLVFESRIANDIHESLPFPIYTIMGNSDPTSIFPRKIDLITTLGGDGTILRAASLFSLQPSVPPILSFSMGTLGFLGEWKFDEYKSAWREVYMSGSGVAVDDLAGPHTQVASNGKNKSSLTTSAPAATTAALQPGATEEETSLDNVVSWGSVRGQSMGVKRVSRMLLRNRLKVGVYDQNGFNINDQLVPTSISDPSQGLGSPHKAGQTGQPPPAFHAINELLIHRGPHPHLAIIDIFLNNHFLTEAVADGILVSTPTGSTAYSLSAGGSIIHPLVGSLLITPICPRSLSFRPLVLPLNTQVVLRLSEKNRGRELEVSIDGKRKTGVSIGMEVRVEGEYVGRTADGSWRGGVPCVIRAPKKGDANGVLEDDDGWVGGLNGLLKFNYPFGEVPP